jgi:hypothetical protein
LNSEDKKCHFSQWLLKNPLKLIIGLGLIYIAFVWSNQSDTSMRGSNNHLRSAHVLPTPWAKDYNNDESRIAQHFAVDTLPGLMRRGLIKKYERHQTGTVLFVAGKIWKERTRFFKESLLSETLVYNKVNNYALETRIVDHRSQKLYAHAVSSDQKEFFD